MTPLARRLPRELKHNLGKYLGIFLLMCGSIALTSGFLLAAHSIGCLIDGMRDEYAIEDGRVTTSFEATDAQTKAAEDAAEGVGGVTLYKNFSIDAAIKKPVGDDGTKRTLRTYAHRTEVDLASYCEGAEPQADDEVAIDRVFAKNNGLAVGDTVELEAARLHHLRHHDPARQPSALPNNSDFTINTVTYGVAEVTDTGFTALEDAGGAPTYTYSFVFNDRDLSVADRTDAEKDMVDALTDADARVDDLIDAGFQPGHRLCARRRGRRLRDVDDAARHHHRDHGLRLRRAHRLHHRGGERHHRHAARERLPQTRDRPPLPHATRHRGHPRRASGDARSAWRSSPSPCATSTTAPTACRPSTCIGAGRFSSNAPWYPPPRSSSSRSRGFSARWARRPCSSCATRPAASPVPSAGCDYLSAWASSRASACASSCAISATSPHSS